MWYRIQIVSFDDAARVRKELLKDAKENLENLLEQTVSDYHESWQTARRNLENQPEYLRYVELEGKITVGSAKNRLAK